jgi:hypothetical protein
VDAQNVSYPRVTVALHRDEEQGLYKFGVVINGEFIPLLHHKLGRIDKLANVGAERQAEQQQQQPAPQQQQPQQ